MSLRAKSNISIDEREARLKNLKYYNRYGSSAQLRNQKKKMNI
jgi:hypothetical protein